MANKLKYWKEAATLIIAARSKNSTCSYLGSQKFSFDYRILMLQRNAKAGFFPSAQVFPGGGFDPADSSPEWLDLFREHCNVRRIKDFGSMVSVRGSRPPMLVCEDHRSPVPLDVAYRICAIRETFEESGILLARERDSKSVCSNGSSRTDRGELTLGQYIVLSESDRKRWRKMVYNDAGQFLSLCKELSCYPDIWSLAEWSNWLTPSDFTTRRFDTMFYISCLDSMPDSFEDKAEIVQSKWVTPLQSLQMYADAETYLPPPQVYEFRRLLRLQNFGELFKFCQRRAFEGTLRYLPVRCDLDDCVVSLLPGDEDYPANPAEASGEEQRLHWHGRSGAESFHAGKVTNRIVFRQVTDYTLLSSCQPECSHVAPVTTEIPAATKKAKL